MPLLRLFSDFCHFLIEHLSSVTTTATIKVRLWPSRITCKDALMASTTCVCSFHRHWLSSLGVHGSASLGVICSKSRTTPAGSNKGKSRELQPMLPNRKFPVAPGGSYCKRAPAPPDRASPRSSAWKWRWPINRIEIFHAISCMFLSLYQYVFFSRN